MDSNEVAEVLENAARLYRDEKVEWCTGNWVDIVDTPDWRVHWNRETQFETPGLPLSACAEGALLRACGFDWNQVARYPVGADSVLAEDRSKGALFKKAQNALLRYIRELTGKGLSVYGWNDSMNARDIENGRAQVIEAMEATAKDLRNG